MYNPVRCAELNIDTAALEAAGYIAIETESDTTDTSES